MAPPTQIVVFTLEDRRYGLTLSCVERIVRAVEITHLPEAPENVLGVINVEGRVIPVVNTRRLLGLKERDVDVQDLFIIMNDGTRDLALVADEVSPVMEIPGQEVISAGKVLPGSGFVEGVAKLDQGMVMILGVENAIFADRFDSLQSTLDGASG